jgi:hypothetical protein
MDDLKEVEDEEWFSDEHRVPLKSLLDRYKSNIIHGLEPSQVEKNRIKYGSNIFKSCSSKPNYTVIKKVVKSFFLGLNILIWLCALLSLLTSGIILLYDGHSYGAEVSQLAT